jgi:hypothetical protein
MYNALRASACMIYRLKKGDIYKIVRCSYNHIIIQVIEKLEDLVSLNRMENSCASDSISCS